MDHENCREGFGLGLQGEKSGRLLKYDPKTKKTSFLLGGLHFANGVALGPKEEYVLVVETSSVRVSRYWLKGAKVAPPDHPNAEDSLRAA